MHLVARGCCPVALVAILFVSTELHHAAKTEAFSSTFPALSVLPSRVRPTIAAVPKTPATKISAGLRSETRIILSSTSADAAAASEKSAAAQKKSPMTIRRLLGRAAVYATLFFAGYRVGGGGNTIGTVTRDARRRFPVASILLAGLFVRELWRSIPSWAKPRLIRRLSSRDLDDASSMPVEEVDPDDMTDFANIAAKLQGLLKLAETKLASPVKFNVQASLLALLQLIGQLKDRRAVARDANYARAGKAGSVEDLEGLDEAMEFADWAYDESPDGKSLKELLKECGFALLKHDKTTVPGFLGHYVAINKVRNIALIGVKGTSGFEDMLTDACGLAMTHELDGPFVKGGSNEIRCHEGILISSRRLADDIQPFVELLLPQGYNILVVGHSLGAGASSLLALILRSRLPSLLGDDGTRLRVLAFASPPILDYDNALACAPFTTTIVNNSDIITRASLANLVVTLEVLKTIHKKLEERGMGSSDAATTLAFIKKLAEGKKGDLLMSADELAQELERAQDAVELRDPDHLYVPGRVVLMYDLWEKLCQEGDKEGKGEGEGEGEGEDTKDSDSDEGSDAEAEQMGKRTAEGFGITNGVANVLRYIEMDERMLDDHMADAYKSSIKSLLTPEAETAEAAAATAE